MSSNPMRGALPAFALSLAALAGVAPLGAQGAMRELYCRGAAGMRMSVELDPSPRDPRFVVMVLEYKRPSTQPGPSLLKLEPGTCTWNMLDMPGVPPEPGRVRVEVWRESQPWSATDTRRMDTTARAGAFFPDKITLPRYLQCATDSGLDRDRRPANDGSTTTCLHGGESDASDAEDDECPGVAYRGDDAHRVRAAQRPDSGAGGRRGEPR